MVLGAVGSLLPGAPTGAAAAASAPTVQPAGSPAFAQDAPDPDVIRVGTTYYGYTTGTTWGNYIGVLTSTAPSSGWRTADGQTYGSTAMGPLPSWEKVNTQTSPGVFAWAGRYVMFYDAFDPSVGHWCLSVATASSPTGPFDDNSAAPFECQADGSVDPSPFVDASGQPWLYWKENDGSASTPAYIWAAPLAPTGTALASSPTQVLTQDTVNHPWETTVENPDMVLAAGSYYLFFSSGRWDSSGYAEGYAVCDGPAGPCTQPQPGPLLASYGQVAGPGAATVFADPSGATWMAYAAWTSPCTSYSCGGQRRLYVAPLTFGGPACSPPARPAGYRFAAADGGVFDFGNLPYCGSAAGAAGATVVGLAATPDEGGYWLATASGRVAAFGDAAFKGDASGMALAAPVVGLAATPDGAGYWLASADGGVFAFGDAAWYGSMGGTRLASPVVGMAADRTTGGYWLVAADGGVFSFHAAFRGSAGAIRLNRPVVGMAATSDGGGYWLVASDGGIFTYGDAAFLGSAGAIRLNRPVVGMAATSDGAGYRLVASDGGVFCYGDAPFYGSTGSITLAQPVTSIGG